MTEVTSGWRSVLSQPLVYEAVQYLVGARRANASLVRDIIRPAPGDRVLDIGCGPGEILRAMPAVDYVGVDQSESYIERAKRAFPGKGRFYCDSVENLAALGLARFDIVIAIGVLHHIDDSQAEKLFRTAAGLIQPEGRIYTADPCFHPDQNFLTRFVIQNDRGRNVRGPDAYYRLAMTGFRQVETRLMEGLLPFPHSVCLLEARDPRR
jgi:2-polyprenyl-3-methyl-5-hydroxy-6-metoxy-1,4-benzoquinol methylase